MRAFVLGFIGLSVVLASDIDYASVLEPLWKQSDTDESGELSLPEFTDAAGKLGVSEEIFTAHSQSFSVLHSSLDTDGSGGLTPEELAAAVQNYPEYKDPLIAAFTNGAGQVPTSLPTASDEIKDADAFVTCEIVVAGKASEIYAGQRQQIKQSFADLAGVPTTSVIITFLTNAAPATGARKLSTDETTIEAKIFVPDTEAAETAQAAMPTDAAAVAALPAFSGMTVTEYAVVAVPKWAPEWGSVAGAILGLIILSILTCVLARCWGKKNRDDVGVKYSGCCETGCCSFFAVKPWAFSEVTAALLFLAFLLFLYFRAAGLTDVIVVLVDVLLDIATSNVTFVAEFQAMIPTQIVSIIGTYQYLFDFIAVFITVPGILVVITMLAAGLCPCGKCHAGRYGCTKCLIVLTDILLLICFIFYCIFAGLALAIEYAPPSLASMINQVTAMCEVMPPEINQLIADNTAAIDQLADSGQDVTTLRAQLADIEGLAQTAEVGCDSMLQLFVEFQNLFLPGVCCIVGVLFAMYVNNTLCCAAGCCKHNQRAIDEAEKKKSGDVQLSNIAMSADEMVAP